MQDIIIYDFHVKSLHVSHLFELETSLTVCVQNCCSFTCSIIIYQGFAHAFTRYGYVVYAFHYVFMQRFQLTILYLGDVKLDLIKLGFTPEVVVLSFIYFINVLMNAVVNLAIIVYQYTRIITVSFIVLCYFYT